MSDNKIQKTDYYDRCACCGCFLQVTDLSHLSEGGWIEDYYYQCNNPNCKSNIQRTK